MTNLYARKRHFPRKIHSWASFLDHHPSFPRLRNHIPQDLAYKKCPCLKVLAMADATEIAVHKAFGQYFLFPYIERENQAHASLNRIQ